MKTKTTTDNWIKTGSPIPTIIYVFLHTTISVQVFRSNRTLTEDSNEEDKLWSLRKWLEWNCNWRNIFYQFRFRPTPIFIIDISKVKRVDFLKIRRSRKGVCFSRFWRNLLKLIWWKVLLGMNLEWIKCIYFILCIHLVSRSDTLL